MGSVLEAPGAAAQALSVGATAKDYDLNHDDTASGDTCAGWYGSDPSGGSGVSGFRAPSYVLLRAALMSTASTDLYEARWVSTIAGVSQDLYELRNVGPADPFVGPEAEGAGKLNLARAVSALRDGAVVYSTASGSGDSLGT